MMIARVPSYQLAVVVVSTESMTRVTSPSRTGRPFLVAIMMLENPAALFSCVLAVIVSCCLSFCSTPSGVLLLAEAIAVCSWSIEMPRAASAVGSIWTRTAYFCCPKIETCATPSIVDSDGEITFSAKASRSVSGTVSLTSDIRRIGASAGLTLR